MTNTRWLSDRREEARRLFKAEYRAWLYGGACPAPRYGK